MRRLRILHILNDLRFSGAETMLASAAPYLISEDIHSTILSTGSEVGPFASVLSQRGYPIVHIPFVKSASFFLSVRREVRRGQYDVVHLHTERGYPLFAASSYGLAAIVRTFHHMYSFAGLLRLRKILERAFCRKCLSVTEVSNSHSGLANERSRFLSGGVLAENWYDDKTFVAPTEEQRRIARLKLGFGVDDFVLLSVGSNVAYKNYDLIIKALSVLAPSMPNVKYLHVGDQGGNDEMSQLAQHLGVVDRVTLPGRVQDSVRYMAACDCYVMPSREEGFGIAAVEALALGLPAVMSKRPALIDFGYYFPNIQFVEPTVAGVAEGVRLIAGLAAADRRAISRNYNAIAARQFGAEVGAARYVSIYRAVAERECN